MVLGLVKKYLSSLRHMGSQLAGHLLTRALGRLSRRRFVRRMAGLAGIGAGVATAFIGCCMMLGAAATLASGAPFAIAGAAAAVVINAAGGVSLFVLGRGMMSGGGEQLRADEKIAPPMPAVMASSFKFVPMAADFDAAAMAAVLVAAPAPVVAFNPKARAA